MSHIVIHDDQNGVTQYHQFDDIEASAAYLELLHNSEGAEGARLFSLNEVGFEVKSYVKVEIDASIESPALTTDADPVEPEGFQGSDDIEYVEAPTTPIESSLVDPPSIEAFDISPSAYLADSGDDSVGSDVRRGLFGR